MKPPCILIVDRFLPALRQSVARILVLERGYSQSRAAELLGITQAMVSKYVSGKQRVDPELSHEVEELSRAVAAVIESPEEATRTLCSYCVSLRESARLCPLHREVTGNRTCHACLNIRAGDNPRNGVLRVMDTAVRLLLRHNVVRLVPEVRSNIAMCTADAAGPEDVASVPGRLIVVRGRLASPTAPEFNASHHTTAMLLSLHRRNPSIRSLMNIRLGDGILEAASGLGYACALLVRDDDGGFDLDELPDSFDCLVDRGAFGIEPGVYLVGADALDVAHKAIALHGALEKE